MELYGHNLDVECTQVIYQPGQLLLPCKVSDTNMQILLVDAQSTDFLPVMTWAILNKKIKG
jgi:hypothetical protein